MIWMIVMSCALSQKRIVKKYVFSFEITQLNIKSGLQRRVLSSTIFKYLIKSIILVEDMIILSWFVQLNQQLIHWKPLHNPSKLKKWQFILRVFWMLTHIFGFLDKKYYLSHVFGWLPCTLGKIELFLLVILCYEFSVSS